MTTPLGFNNQTCPLAISDPSIRLAPPVSTRFSATLLALGWLNVTRSPAPISKPCQATTMRSLVWFTSTERAPVVIEPLPAVMVPPFGNVCAPTG